MASSVDITFASWDSVHWDITYDGTGTISVSREAGKSTATVKGTATIYAHTGDQAGWKLHMKVGDKDEVTADFPNNPHWAIPVRDEKGNIVDYEAPYDTTSVTQDVDVENVSGSLYVQLWVTVEDGYGTKSSVYSATVTYDSIGIAKIDSCSDMKIGDKVNIGWTAYSTSFSYEFEIACGGFSGWSGKISASSATSQKYTNYTVPADIARYISAWSTEGTVTVYLRTYTGSTGNYKYLGSSSTTATVYTTSSQAATIQDSWTLKETNTNNPFKTSKTDIGGDGTYRFVKNISQLKLTVYAYGAYGSIPTYLSGEYYGQKFSAVEFKSTGITVYGYPQYKAEITFTPKTAKSDRWWWFSVEDSREYITPVVGNGIFSRYYYSDGGYYYLTMNVADYTAPQITALKANLSGTVASVVASTVVTNVTNTSGTSINSLTATLTRKKTSTGESKSTDVISKLGLGSKSGITLASDNLSDLDSNSYEYTLTLTDKYTSVSKTAGTGVVALSFYKGGKGAAFFKEATTEGLSVNGDFYVLNPDTQQAITWVYPSGNNTDVRFWEPTAQKWSWAMESRNIGDDTNIIPEVIGWDSNNQSYMFRFAKSGAYVQGWANIGSASKPVYFDGNGRATPCLNLGPSVSSLPNFANTGSALRPIYINSSGQPTACRAVIDKFKNETVSLVLGTIEGGGGTSGEKQLDLSSLVSSDWKAMAIAGYYIEVWDSTSSKYVQNHDCRITPSQIYLSDYNRLDCTLVNEGSSNWYTRITVKLLCIYQS